MMCSNAEDLKRRADWDGAKGNSRQKLLLQLQSEFFMQWSHHNIYGRTYILLPT